MPEPGHIRTYRPPRGTSPFPRKLLAEPPVGRLDQFGDEDGTPEAARREHQERQARDSQSGRETEGEPGPAQARPAASAPRCRTRRPIRTTFAVSANAVSSRAAPSPQAVPATFAASATGAISSMDAGGWTIAKFRYAMAP